MKKEPTAGIYQPYSISRIHPEGWLRKRLMAMTDGLTGHAEALYPEFLGPDSEWLGGPFNWNTERAPYYIRGLVPLAWLLDDSELKDKVQKWVEWAIVSQQEDGSFGPKHPENDWWWKYTVMLYALRDYYDVTRDERIVGLVTAYLRYYAKNIGNHPPIDWGKARPGDELEIALWGWELCHDQEILGLCYDIIKLSYDVKSLFSQNSFLNFDYAAMSENNECTADWYVEHSVNIAQMVKFFSLAYRLTGDASYLEAYETGLKGLWQDHGVLCGMPCGTEWLSGRGSTQGIELCAIVERMLSEQIHMFTTGLAKAGDTIEMLAFNLLPGALSSSMRQLQYYTLPNQPIATPVHPGFPAPDSRWPDSVAPGPHSGFPCCAYNWHMGWPYFARHLWAQDAKGRIAVMLYAPSTLSASVNGKALKLQLITGYPFGDEGQLIVDTNRHAPVAFTLCLRIPEWCRMPQFTKNGSPIVPVLRDGFAEFDGMWGNGDLLAFRYPMEVRVEPQILNAVSIYRGPLLYSLEIDEQWQQRQPLYHEGKDFSPYALYPKSHWNYALDLSGFDGSEQVRVRQQPLPDDPFAAEKSPITLLVMGKQIASWDMDDKTGRANEVPLSPVQSDSVYEPLRLIPYGLRNLHITVFPVLGSGNQQTVQLNTTLWGGRIPEKCGEKPARTRHITQLNAPKSGVYVLAFKYRNPNTRSASIQISVNGDQPMRLVFAPLFSDHSQGTTSVTACLSEGINTVEITAENWPLELLALTYTMTT